MEFSDLIQGAFVWRFSEKSGPSYGEICTKMPYFCKNGEIFSKKSENVPKEDEFEKNVENFSHSDEHSGVQKGRSYGQFIINEGRSYGEIPKIRGVRMEKFPKIGAFWPSPGVMKYMGVPPPRDLFI